MAKTFREMRQIIKNHAATMPIDTVRQILKEDAGIMDRVSDQEARDLLAESTRSIPEARLPQIVELLEPSATIVDDIITREKLFPRRGAGSQLLNQPDTKDKNSTVKSAPHGTNDEEELLEDEEWDVEDEETHSGSHGRAAGTTELPKQPTQVFERSLLEWVSAPFIAVWEFFANLISIVTRTSIFVVRVVGDTAMRLLLWYLFMIFGMALSIFRPQWSTVALGQVAVIIVFLSITAFFSEAVEFGLARWLIENGRAKKTAEDQANRLTKWALTPLFIIVLLRLHIMGTLMALPDKWNFPIHMVWNWDWWMIHIHWDWTILLLWGFVAVILSHADLASKDNKKQQKIHAAVAAAKAAEKPKDSSHR